METEYLEIIEEITKKLTGNNAEDFEYLKKVGDRYIDHKFSTEILRAIGRMLAERIPADKLDSIGNILGNNEQFVDNIINEVNFKLKDGKIDEAEQLLEKITYDDLMFQDDTASAYFSFNNLLEEIYYNHKFKPQKEIRVNPLIKLEIYLLHGYILLEKGKPEQALERLNAGLKFNPLDTRLLFEKGEIYKVLKDMDSYKEITDSCLEYAYNSSDIARCYRNYGFYFIEKEDYEAAISSFIFSTFYEKSDFVYSELFYIQGKTGKIVDHKYYQEHFGEILTDRKIQIGVNRDIASLAYTLANKAYDENEKGIALYYFELLYNITEDEEIKEKINEIQNELNI